MLIFRLYAARNKNRENNENNHEGTNHFWNHKKNGESIEILDDSLEDAKLKKSSNNSLTPTSEQSFGKKFPQYNSFRMMKQKVL